MLPVLKLGYFGLSFCNWWNSKNGDTNTIAKNEIIYGVTDNFARYLGLNLCIIIAKYYLYTASRKEEEFYFDAFIAFLVNKIKIEKHKSKSQINMWESHLFYSWCPQSSNVRFNKLLKNVCNVSLENSPKNGTRADRLKIVFV